MAEAKKKATKKDPMADVQKHAEKFTKVADETFGKLKKHFDKKKVDNWQKKWLEVPANRKKYEKLQDTPEVVGEELTAMVNDIIDFAQGEETGKSGLFKKVKGLFGKAASTVKGGVAEAKKGADIAAKQAKKTASKAKSTAGKAATSAAKKTKKAAKK